MADSQLIDYIRTRVNQGAARSTISIELVRAGWSPAQLNEALNELAVPMDGAPVPAPVPVPSPLSVQARSPEPAISPLVAPRMPGNTLSDAPFASQGPSRATFPQTMNSSLTSGTPPAEIPGLFALIGEAFRTYRENLGAVLTVGAVGLLLVVFMQVLIVGVIVAGVAFAFAGGILAITIGAGIVVALMLVAWWVGALIMAGSAHALDGSSAGKALQEGFRQSLSYAWLSILSMGLFVGYLLVFAIMPAGILFGVFLFIPTAKGFGSLIAGAYLVIALLIITILIATRYSIALWVLIRGEGKGLYALLLSARRVKPQFGTIGVRMFLGAILYAVAYIFLAFIGGLVAGPLRGITGTIVNAAVKGGLAYLFFLPLMFAFLLAMYRRVQSVMAPSAFTVSGSERWGMLGLATIGILFGFALPFGAAAITASLHTAASHGNDAAVLSDLATIQTESLLYYDEHGNSYGTAESCSEGMFAEDPVVAQSISWISKAHSAAECRADGVSFLAYAPLSTGDVYCVDSGGYIATTSLADISGTQCSMGEASSTPATSEPAAGTSTAQSNGYPAPMRAAGFQTGSQTPNAPNVYTDAKSGYSLTFPTGWGWADVPYADGTKGIMAHPGMSVTVQVSTNVRPANGMTLEQEETKEVSSIQSVSGTATVESKTVDGYPAALITSSLTTGGGTTWQSLNLTLLKKGTFYVLDGEAPADQWSAYKSIIANILESITFSS